MFLPGSEVATALDRVTKEQIQPAGVDLTVDAVWELDQAGELDFSNEHRRVPEGRELAFKTPLHLSPGAYVVRYGQKVSVPADCMGLVLPRSSLMRMGATLTSAIWDPGYSGQGRGLLIVMNPHGIILHPNARIGQLTLIRGRATGAYSGTYQHEK